MRRNGNKLAYFYNPFWRWMGEPDALEAEPDGSYTRPRFMGSHGSGLTGGNGWKMWDNILASRGFLRRGPLTLLENSVRLVRSHNDCSDHAAVAFELAYS